MIKFDCVFRDRKGEKARAKHCNQRQEELFMALIEQLL